MYSVYPAVKQRSDSLVCLLVHVHSDSALSGVTGFYPQFLSHTDRLHLQQDPKTCRQEKYIDITCHIMTCFQTLVTEPLTISMLLKSTFSWFKGLVHFQNENDNYYIIFLIIYSPSCNRRCPCLSCFSRKESTFF